MGTVQRVVGKKGITWRARVEIGRDLNGKRIRETQTFARKRDADEWVARQETLARQHPQAASYRTLTLQVYVTEHWLPFYRTQAAPSSYRKREADFRRHILPRLGTHRLQDITPRHIQWLYQEIAETLSPSSIANVSRSLQYAFNVAVKWEMMTRNPCDGAKTPRVEKRTPDLWNAEQFRQFLAAEPDPIYRTLWVTLVLTGARLGEILALTWNDLDRESSTIAISKSLTRNAQGQWTIGPTKTAQSNRVVSVPVLLWPLFDEVGSAPAFSVFAHVPNILGARTHRAKPTIPVFINKHGRPISESMAYNAWGRAIHTARLPAMHIHDLRHLHATIGLSLGVPLKVVSERLGHSNIGITADTYTHVQRDLQHDAADRIAAYLLGHEEEPPST